MTLFNIKLFAGSVPALLLRLPITLFVALFSFAAALFIGLAAALVKINRVPVLKHLVNFYISAVRGSPMLVQLFLICYGLPKVIHFLRLEYGLFAGFNPNDISPVYYAVITFIINLGAFLAEIIRSSIEAVGKGQFEAAQSVGMTYGQTIRRIIIPQAFAVALPNLGGGVISTVKDTSFIFIIGIIDIMGEAKIIGSRALAYLESYTVAALIYWAVCFSLEKLFYYLEKRAKVYDKSIARPPERPTLKPGA
jgi:L-cystine transport system permease protein